MDMNQDQERVVVDWPGRAAVPQPGAAPGNPAPREGRGQPRLPEPGREAVFDIADFEAIAAFAGLPRRRAG